jgi:hypothetical protein
MQNALSNEWTGPSITTATGPHQHSNCRVEVQRQWMIRVFYSEIRGYANMVVGEIPASVPLKNRVSHLYPKPLG